MDTRLKRLYEAAYVGDVDYLNELLEEDKLLLDRVVTTTEVNDNPLHIAAFRGHASFARNILQQKPELAREFNAQGMSPLHVAAAEGHLRVAEELLQVDADLCYLRENKEGYLPIHVAMIKGRHNLVTLLIEKCEDFVNLRTNSSESLLHLAVKAKRLEMVELLTERGVTKLVLNEKDENQNTSLHLAFAGRQQKVIKHLLSQDDIEVNAMNSAGLTPLDVLLVTNHEIGDLCLGEILRAAGGKTGKEIGAADAHSTLPARVVSSPSNQVRRTSSLTKTEENYDSVGNLMVVATLVATVTFTAALNPPGGSIQMSFEDDNRTDPTYLNNWKNMTTLYPAGSPVYLWQLKYFFKYDCFALLTSVGVMLLCISDLARSKFLRKCMILVMWVSIYSMVTAFISALKILFNIQQNHRQFKWFKVLEFSWYGLFGSAIGRLITQAFFQAIEERPSYLPNWLRRLCEKINSIHNRGKLWHIGFIIIVLFACSWTIIIPVVCLLVMLTPSSLT